MTNPEDATIQWRTDIPAYAWVVGEEPAVGVEFSMDDKDFGPWTHGDD